MVLAVTETLSTYQGIYFPGYTQTNKEGISFKQQPNLNVEIMSLSFL
jgi:hypothetical protein